MIPSFRSEFDAARDPDAAQFALNLCKTRTWTPTLTFATPGDVTIVYSTRVGRYVKIGQLVFIWVNIATTTFTHTTAAGNLLITGLPHVPSTAINWTGGIADCSGITPGGSYSMWGAEITGGNIGIIMNDLVTPARAFAGVASHITGTNVIIRTSISYCTA